MKILAQIGLAVWQQILLCLVALLYAGAFAWRPARGRLQVLAAVATGTLLATLASVCMGLAMVGRSAARLAKDRVDFVPTLLTGAGEAVAGGLLGFATLTLVTLLAAVGLARQAAPPQPRGER